MLAPYRTHRGARRISRVVWDFRTITPLERPSELAGKDVLTDEEAAEQEQRTAEGWVDRPPGKETQASITSFGWTPAQQWCRLSERLSSWIRRMAGCLP